MSKPNQPTQPDPNNPSPNPPHPGPTPATAPKKSWWKKALDQIGNAIGEAKFGQ